MTYAATPLTEQAPAPKTPATSYAANYLLEHHGALALREAIRHGMGAKRRGDGSAANFWCVVCSALIQIQQNKGQAGD